MRTLTDTELHSVVGGQSFDEVMDRVDSYCENNEGGELEIEVVKPGKGLNIKGGGLNTGGITIKIKAKCGKGETDDGNEDGDEEQEKEDTKDK